MLMCIYLYAFGETFKMENEEYKSVSLSARLYKQLKVISLLLIKMFNYISSINSLTHLISTGA